MGIQRWEGRFLTLPRASEPSPDPCTTLAGVALLPLRMFAHDLRRERLVQPFVIDVTFDAHWLTRLKSRPETRAMATFRIWLLAEFAVMPPTP